LPFLLFNFLLLEFILVLEFDFLDAGVFLIGFLLISDDFAKIVPFLLDGIELISN
jgi:hypothetical protein